MSQFHKGLVAGCDYLLLGMNMDLDHPIVQTYSKDQCMLITMENPSIWSVPCSIVSRSGIIVSPFPAYGRESSYSIRAHPAIPWFYGIEFDGKRGLEHYPVNTALFFDDMVSMRPPSKSKLLSIVVSGKSGSIGYQWRLSLAERLKQVLGPDCDIYGFGHNPISDKRDAIDPYLFTLCIENESHDYYWTEKLADAYLGYAYPIYSGDRRVQDDFPAHISTLEFGMDVNKAVKKVICIISGYDAGYSQAIIENRNSILFRHNMFYSIDSVLRGI